MHPEYLLYAHHFGLPETNNQPMENNILGQILGDALDIQQSIQQSRDKAQHQTSDGRVLVFSLAVPPRPQSSQHIVTEDIDHEIVEPPKLPAPKPPDHPANE
jgi:hypothetical protein